MSVIQPTSTPSSAPTSGASTKTPSMAELILGNTATDSNFKFSVAPASTGTPTFLAIPATTVPVAAPSPAPLLGSGNEVLLGFKNRAQLIMTNIEQANSLKDEGRLSSGVRQLWSSYWALAPQLRELVSGDFWKAIVSRLGELGGQSGRLAQQTVVGDI